MITKKILRSITIVTLIHIAMSGAALAGKIIYVDVHASGANNGSSWNDAYKHLQDAMTDALKGDEIRVAQGIYRPDRNRTWPYGTGAREATFQLKNGVAIYGGFRGVTPPPLDQSAPQANPDDRDITVFKTILSGDLSGNDGANFTNNGENSYHVVTGSDCNRTAIIDGFTVTCGNANVRKYRVGAGMYNRYGNPTIQNCTFSGNSTTGNGAGMSNSYSSPAITDCSFNVNYADSDGGGMNNEHHSRPTITNCTFSDNSAHMSGGGIENSFSSEPVLSNCTFSRNSAKYGGAINGHWTSSILTNCIFSKNTADGWGGAMFNWDNTPILINCIFKGNSSGKWGGAICNWGDGNPILTNCLFKGNLSSSGGGIYNYGTARPKMTNCTFVANLANKGNGIACDSPSQEHPSVLQISNCILWDPKPLVPPPPPPPGATQVTLDNSIALGPSNEIWNNDNSVITITYSDVHGGWPGEGNIDVDPCFVDPGYFYPGSMSAEGDHHLSPVSPCIDTGDSNVVSLSIPTDLDGGPRIRGSVVDMGVYENPTIVFVDVDSVGANNGSSWIDAYNYLQDALAVAFSGDEIRIAEGIYKPDQGTEITPGDRTATFQLKNGVVMKGGYAGLGTPDANVRDVEIYKTILSGDLRRNDDRIYIKYDMEDDETREDNSHHVVTATNIDSTAMLEGCTIIGGYADSTAHRFMGGGIYIYKASPTVMNCTFTGNWALNYGGGMCIDTDSQPVITNCNFIANSATDGAGADNEYSNPTFVNCLFADNWAWEYNADSYGGAGMYNFYSNPTVINCVFAVNGSPGWGDGGGMQNNNGSPTLINCTFCGNYSANGRTRAGGIYNLYESNPRLTNCILWGNTNPEGQGQSAQIYGGHPVINYSCIEGWTGELGGIGNIGADPCFVKVGCWFPGYLKDESSEDLPVWGDYHLLQTSPCIDIADNNGLPDDISDLDGDGETVERLPFDIDSNPRIFDGDNDNIPVVDMGAYEFLNETPIADAGPDQVAECACNTAHGTKVILDGTNSSDPDHGPLTYTWTGPFLESPIQGAAPTVTLEGGCPGEYVITLVVNDGIENSEPNEVVITVVDTTRPEFELSVMPTMLWPPNHKMMEITPSWTVRDDCDASADVSLVSIVAHEGDDTIGEGHTSNDIEIGNDGSIFVRSERSGNNMGRIYIITYQAVDEVGNRSVRSANVSVPHEFKLLARIGERWLCRSNNINVPEDLNSDGIVNLMDIAIFSNNWIR